MMQSKKTGQVHKRRRIREKEEEDEESNRDGGIAKILVLSCNSHVEGLTQLGSPRPRSWWRRRIPSNHKASAGPAHGEAACFWRRPHQCKPRPSLERCRMQLPPVLLQNYSWMRVISTAALARYCLLAQGWAQQLPLIQLTAERLYMQQQKHMLSQAEPPH